MMSAPTVYHVELRQFPHNHCRFNLSEGELRAMVIEPWAHGGWVELGERKWSPHQARLTVLAGPPLPVEQLSMGRGWRNARRVGRDVTQELLGQAGAGDAGGGGGGDSLGLELLAKLASGPVALRRVWELACARHPQRTAGECLELAERSVGALVDSGSVGLARAGAADDPEARWMPVEMGEAARLLGAIDSWTEESVGVVRR